MTNEDRLKLWTRDMGRGMTLLHKYLGRGDRIEWTGLTWRVREKVNRHAPLTYRTYDRTGNNGIKQLWE